MRVEKSEIYSHSKIMAIVERSTELAAPAEAVWRAVKTPSAFRTVTRGILTMPVIKHRDDGWRDGETVQGWVFLFGCLMTGKCQGSAEIAVKHQPKHCQPSAGVAMASINRSDTRNW